MSCKTSGTEHTIEGQWENLGHIFNSTLHKEDSTEEHWGAYTGMVV